RGGRPMEFWNIGSRDEAISWRQNGERASEWRLMSVVAFWPIAERRLDKRQRRHRGRVRAQDARPEAQAQYARRREDRGALVVVETAFRPDEQANAAVRARHCERV